MNSALWRRYFECSSFNFTGFSLILDVFLVQNQLLHSFRSSARSSRFGFGQSEHVWWPHHANSARKRRENVAFTQLGRGGDVVDIGRGCGGLQPNLLLRMKDFHCIFTNASTVSDPLQPAGNMNTGAPTPKYFSKKVAQTSCTRFFFYIFGIVVVYQLAGKVLNRPGPSA